MGINPHIPSPSNEVIMSKAYQQMLIGVVLVVFAGGLLLYALVFASPHPAMIREPLGPLGWPVGVLVALIFLSLVIIGKGWLEKRHDIPKSKVPTAKPYTFRVTLAIVVSLLLYIVALMVFGFALATLFWLIITLYTFGTKRLLSVFGLSVGITSVLFLLFTKFLIIPLPRGMWIFESFSRLIGH